MNAGGTIPMVAVFLLFLVFPIFEFPLPFADAETTLTTGLEVADEFFVGNVHQFYCKRVTIKEFYRDDQCYAGPGQEIIGSFSIVLQFGSDGMLGTDGLIICFVGQLDGDSIARGLRVNEQYRIYNKWNHPLAKMCKEAKEKLMKGKECQDPECYEFVNREWHAIQFKEHPNGRDLEMVMSTMDFGPGKIRIPRDQLENGLLVFKMTTAEEASAKFSKTIGPGKHVSRRPALLEKKNEVKVAMDEKLEGIFFGNIHHGARLRHFNGPYAVTVDFLPLMEGVHQIDVFVIRSECSDVPAAFLMPSDSTPPDAVVKKEIAKRRKIDVFPDSNTYIRGRIDGNAIFEYKFKIGNEERTIRMIIEFEGNQQNTEAKIELNGVILQLPAGKGIKFVKGANFYFKILSKDDYMLASMNCGPFLKIPRNFSIEDLLRININVSGEVKLYEMWNDKYEMGPMKGEKYHARIDVKLDKSLMGYFIRAKPNENWKEIKLTLKQSEKNVMEFIANHTKSEMILRDDNQNKISSIKEMPEENEVFELQFYLMLGNFIEVFFNDVSVESIFVVNNKVDSIQIDADFELIKNATIYQTPWIFPILTQFNGGKGVQMQGKIKPKIDMFSIRFYSLSKVFDEKINEEECFNPEIGDCAINLIIDVNFKSGKTLMGQFYFDQNELKKKVWKNQTYDHNRFVEGKDFQITIKYENGKFQLIYDHQNGQMDEFAPGMQFNDGRQIQIIGEVFLFDVPQVV